MPPVFARPPFFRPLRTGLPGLRRLFHPSRRQLDPDRLVGLVCAASTAVGLLVA